MDVKEETILGPGIRDHWYYVAKGRALRQFLGARPAGDVLDVGAGSGIFSRQLIAAGLARRAVCVDPAYETERSEMVPGGELVFVRRVDRVTQPLVLMMDVLEHVDDDVALMRSYTDGMPATGDLLITVPAFQFLWSGHDVFLEHRRRYTIASLRRSVRAAGLTVVRDRYFFGSLFPAVSAMRLWRRALGASGRVAPRSELRLYPAWLNAALTAVHDLERRSLFHVNQVAGLTIFCLARKL